MTNEELIDTLLVTGKIKSKTIKTPNGVYNSPVKAIIDSPRFIGDFYKKFGTLPDIREADILFIIGMIIIRFNLNESEIDLLYKRLKLIKLCTNLKYNMQALQIVDDLERSKNKTIKSELFKCFLLRKVIASLYLYSANSEIEIYYLVKEDGVLNIYDVRSVKLMCTDIKYVAISDEGYNIVTEHNYNKSIYIRDRYKFKIF